MVRANPIVNAQTVSGARQNSLLPHKCGVP